MRWGYHVAATIREWMVSRTRRTSTLRGSVDGLNSAYAYQHGLYFVTLTKAGAWSWPVTRLEISAQRVTAELGPQQKER